VIAKSINAPMWVYEFARVTGFAQLSEKDRR
jgi:hypothetical protein